jgi:hypothetical protein
MSIISGSVVEEEMQEDIKSVKGIGLYKIRYEMDVVGSSRDQNYVAGIVAYTSREAIDTLVAFGKKKVKGFKGMKVSEVAFEGLCHDFSDLVKHAVVDRAKMDGEVVSKEDYESMLAEKKKETRKSSKKSILKEEVKE